MEIKYWWEWCRISSNTWFCYTLFCCGCIMNSWLIHLPKIPRWSNPESDGSNRSVPKFHIAQQTVSLGHYFTDVIKNMCWSVFEYTTSPHVAFTSLAWRRWSSPLNISGGILRYLQKTVCLQTWARTCIVTKLQSPFSCQPWTDPKHSRPSPPSPPSLSQ